MTSTAIGCGMAKPGIPRRRGLFVAFLGPDGSGKSSIIRRLQERLGAQGIAVRSYHLRPRLGFRPSDGAPVTEPHARSSRSRLVSLAKLMYWWMDYVIGYWLVVEPHLKGSRFVVFDRYYHDLLVDPCRYRYGASMRFARFVGRLVPQPDLMYVLDARTEILRSRKQEVAVPEIERQRVAYGRIADSIPYCQVLRVDRPLSSVVDDVEEAVLDLFVDEKR